MTKSLLYKYAAIGLLLLNISMIAFFFLTRHKPGGKGMGFDFRPRAIHMLELDDEQKAAFVKLAEEHRQRIDAINEQQRSLLKPVFKSLTDTNQTGAINSITTEIEQLEGTKIAITYQHFQDVKSILREEQLPNYEVFLKEALGILLLDSKK